MLSWHYVETGGVSCASPNQGRVTRFRNVGDVQRYWSQASDSRMLRSLSHGK